LPARAGAAVRSENVSAAANAAVSKLLPNALRSTRSRFVFSCRDYCQATPDRSNRFFVKSGCGENLTADYADLTDDKGWSKNVSTKLKRSFPIFHRQRDVSQAVSLFMAATLPASLSLIQCLARAVCTKDRNSEMFARIFSILILSLWFLCGCANTKPAEQADSSMIKQPDSSHEVHGEVGAMYGAGAR
jgi:hypothetical protein